MCIKKMWVECSINVSYIKWLIDVEVSHTLCPHNALVKGGPWVINSNPSLQHLKIIWGMKQELSTQAKGFYQLLSTVYLSQLYILRHFRNKQRVGPDALCSLGQDLVRTPFITELHTARGPQQCFGFFGIHMSSDSISKGPWLKNLQSYTAKLVPLWGKYIYDTYHIYLRTPPQGIWAFSSMSGLQIGPT